MTEALSGERTPEKGGSAVIELLPMAETDSTAAERGSRQSSLLLESEEAGRGLGLNPRGRREGVRPKRLESGQGIPAVTSDD